MKNLTKNKSLLITAGLALVAVLAIGAYFTSQHKPPAEKFHPKAPETTKKTTTTNTDTKATSPASTMNPIPQKTTPTESQSGNITITSPTQGSTMQDGTTISGKALIGSGDKVFYRLKGGNSGQVAVGPVSLSGTSFSFPLGFSNEIKGGQDQGTLQVYSVGTDGTETNIASVNVNIQG